MGTIGIIRAQITNFFTSFQEYHLLHTLTHTLLDSNGCHMTWVSFVHIKEVKVAVVLHLMTTVFSQKYQA